MAQSGKFQCFVSPDGQSEQKLTIWANACCNLNIWGKIFDFFVCTYKPNFQKFPSGLATYIQGSYCGGVGDSEMCSGELAGEMIGLRRDSGSEIRRVTLAGM